MLNRELTMSNTTDPTSLSPTEYRFEGGPTLVDGESETVASLRIIAAALAHLGQLHGLGPLDAAVLAFDRGPLALVAAPDGCVHAAIASPDSQTVPGSLLATLRRRVHDGQNGGGTP